MISSLLKRKGDVVEGSNHMVIYCTVLTLPGDNRGEASDYLEMLSKEVKIR
jgi:hypothetical protein